jgi:hypothetical protein
MKNERIQNLKNEKKTIEQKLQYKQEWLKSFELRKETRIQNLKKRRKEIELNNRTLPDNRKIYSLLTDYDLFPSEFLFSSYSFKTNWIRENFNVEDWKNKIIKLIDNGIKKKDDNYKVIFQEEQIAFEILRNKINVYNNFLLQINKMDHTFCLMLEYCFLLSFGTFSKLSPQIKSFLNFKYSILNVNEILQDKTDVVIKYGKQSFISKAVIFLVKLRKSIIKKDKQNMELNINT